MTSKALGFLSMNMFPLESRSCGRSVWHILANMLSGSAVRVVFVVVKTLPPTLIDMRLLDMIGAFEVTNFAADTQGRTSFVRSAINRLAALEKLGAHVPLSQISTESAHNACLVALQIWTAKCDTCEIPR